MFRLHLVQKKLVFTCSENFLKGKKNPKQTQFTEQWDVALPFVCTATLLLNHGSNWAESEQRKIVPKIR